MGRGSYLGGSTIIGPKSGWFSRPKPKVKVRPKKNPEKTRSAKLAVDSDAERRRRAAARAVARRLREERLVAQKEAESRAREEKLARQAADTVAIEQLTKKYGFDSAAFNVSKPRAKVKKLDLSVKDRLAQLDKKREEQKMAEADWRKARRNAYRLIRGGVPMTKTGTKAVT